MKLKKTLAWKAINAQGAIREYINKKAAQDFAGEWGLVKETFVHTKVH